MTIPPPNPDDIDPNPSAGFSLTSLKIWADGATTYIPTGLPPSGYYSANIPISDLPAHPNDKQFYNPCPRFKRCPYCKTRNIIADRFDGTCSTCGKRVYDEVKE